MNEPPDCKTVQVPVVEAEAHCGHHNRQCDDATYRCLLGLLAGRRKNSMGGLSGVVAVFLGGYKHDLMV